MINIDFASLRRIGLTHTIASQFSLLDAVPNDARLVRVATFQRDRLVVHDGQQAFPARALPGLLQTLQTDNAGLAVGDWVVCAEHAHGEHWVSARVPPVTHIARRGNDGRRQTLVSNVDTALLVMGLDHVFNLRRLERYVALAQTSGVAAVVVMSKADIGDMVEQRMAELRRRLPHSIPALALNTLSGEASEQLAPWLGAGQTLVLLGSSGAGKSTLTNTLCGAAQATGAVRGGDGRGRHTTTARSLHLCEGGACIIDTPGLRSWQADADADSLAASFDDVATLALGCQFRDCRHEAEPGCAVRATVDPDRLRNYQKLLREARRGEATPLERIAARAKWKVVLKAAGARAKGKQRG